MATAILTPPVHFPQDRRRLEWAPGLWLDARRAVWLPQWRALLIADLHMGYAWAHRAAGNLFPVQTGDDPVARLRALVLEYSPEVLIVLGDIVHSAAPTKSLIEDLQRLAELASLTRLEMVAGNHDKELPALLRSVGIGWTLQREVRLGPHLLLHGDGAQELPALARLQVTRDGGGRIFFGHEHPAMVLSDGVATSVRCPCFLAGEDALVLPAFTTWAAGVNLRRDPFLSAFARQAMWTHTVAIVAGKLLPFPF